MIGIGDDRATTTQCGNSPVVEKNDYNKQSSQQPQWSGKLLILGPINECSNQVPMEMDPKLSPGDGEDLNKSL